MSRPEKLPVWAAIDVVDPISGSNNVIEPPEELKQTGWTYASQVPRNWLNWLHREYYLWIKYFDETLNRPESVLHTEKPSASDSGAGKIIYISNLETGGTMAFSDGTNWRKISDNSII